MRLLTQKLASVTCLLLFLAWPTLHAQSDSFNVTVKMTPAGAGIDPWLYSSSRDLRKVRTIDSVSKGQEYQAQVFFHNYALGDNGRIDISYDIRILDPLGNLYHEQAGIPGMRTQLNENKGPILASQVVKLSHDPKDRLGKYTFEITAHDRVSGSTAINSSSIRLRDYEPQTSFDTKEGYHKWLQVYYITPQPQSIVPAYLKFSTMDFEQAYTDSSARGIFIIETAFFKQLFENNRWLATKLAGEYDGASLHQKKKIIFMLQQLGYGGDAFFSRLENDLKSFAEKFASYEPGAAIGQLEKPEAVDALWAQFYATGNIEPIRKIIKGFNYAEYRDFPNRFSSGNVPDKHTENFNKGLIFQATDWSLKSNAKQHSVVRQYLEQLFVKEELTFTQELWVGTILADAGISNYAEYAIPEGQAVMPEALEND